MWLLALAAALAWDLEEARARAVDAAIAVEQAEARAEAARADTRDVAGGLLPSVTGFASVGTGQGFTSFGFQRPVRTQLGVGARGAWTLVSPREWAALSAARHSARGREATAGWARVDARRQATVAYAAALGAAAEEEALRRAAADAASAADAVRALVSAGLRPAADAARATAEAAAVSASLLDAAWRVEARCGELRALLREPAEGPCALAPVPSWPTASAGPSSHPALDAAAAALAASRAGATSTGLAMAPTVSASGTAAWYATDEAAGGLGWNAGAELELPLFAGGSGWARVGSARAEVDIAALALEEQERALRVALRSAQARHRAAEAALAAREAGRVAAEEALALVEERYRAGLADLTEWMDARRARDEAAVGLASAHAAVGVALAELEAARGVGG